MAHTIQDKKKLLHRVRRIRGQVEVIEKDLEAEQDCYAVLQTIAACRGAMNAMMGNNSRYAPASRLVSCVG